MHRRCNGRAWELAVQAYSKRALDVIDWVAATARLHGRRMTIRLVKGAYWDKRDQARPRARTRRLSGVHAQDHDGCVLSGLRGLRVQSCRCDLGAICHSQRAQHCVYPGIGSCRRRIRIPAAARNGAAPVRRSGAADRRLPARAGICARGRAQGFVGLSGAAATGKRRQHLFS